MAAEPHLIDPEPYEIPLPRVDGKRAERIAVSFGGGVELDWRIADDLDFVNSLELGKDVELIVTCTVSKKGYSYSADGATGYGVGLRVHSLEAK